MRNRDLFFRKLEIIENDLKALKFMVNRGQPIADFVNKINSMEDVIFDLKSAIEREPLSPSELNKIQ